MADSVSTPGVESPVEEASNSPNIPPSTSHPVNHAGIDYETLENLMADVDCSFRMTETADTTSDAAVDTLAAQVSDRDAFIANQDAIIFSQSCFIKKLMGILTKREHEINLLRHAMDLQEQGLECYKLLRANDHEQIATQRDEIRELIFINQALSFRIGILQEHFATEEFVVEADKSDDDNNDENDM